VTVSEPTRTEPSAQDVMDFIKKNLDVATVDVASQTSGVIVGSQSDLTTPPPPSSPPSGPQAWVIIVIVVVVIIILVIGIAVVIFFIRRKQSAQKKYELLP